MVVKERAKTFLRASTVLSHFLKTGSVWSTNSKGNKIEKSRQ